MCDDPQWVGQQDERGCGYAVCAMIAGLSYESVKRWFDGKLGAMYLAYVDCFLAEHGFAVARKHQFKLGIENKDWPPKPWWNLHLCEVVVSDSSPCNHFVLMLENGEVLDPLVNHRRTLEVYNEVLNVAAVARLGPGWTTSNV